MKLLASFMSTRRTGVSRTYFFLRLANVAVRPLTLFAIAHLAGDLLASAIALAFAFSAWMMAPMTFGSFRWLLPLERRHEPGSYAYRLGQQTYRWTIYISLLLCFPALLVIAAVTLNSWTLAGLVCFVVIYDFLSHEESRRLLYQGELVSWARFLLWRNSIMPMAWLAVIGIGRLLAIDRLPHSGIATWLAAWSAAITVVCFVRFHKKLFIPVERPLQHLRLAAHRIKQYWQYAACSLLAKSHQNIDKLLVAFIMPEATWIISIIGYCANLPVMAYEMMTLATLKSKIMSLNAQEIADRRIVNRSDVVLFLLIGGPAAIAAYVFLVVQDASLPPAPLIAVYFLAGWLLTVTAKKSELVLWSGSDRWTPFWIDAAAGLMTSALSALVLLTSPLLILIKVPAIFGLSVKWILSDNHLKRFTK